MCIYTHVLHNIETLVGQKNKRKLGQQGMPRAVRSQALIYYLLLSSNSPALFVKEPSIPKFAYESSHSTLIQFHVSYMFFPTFLQHTSFRTPLLFQKYSPEVITFISGVLAIDLSITTTNSFLVLHSSFAYTIHLFFVK
jgi:hypothetical protein